MKSRNAFTWLAIAALLNGCAEDRDQAAVPADIAATTRIEIQSKPATGGPALRTVIRESLEVAAVVREVSTLRAGKRKVQAVIFEPVTRVRFLAGDHRITEIFVFYCETLEQAPVSGKRFFTYSAGMNKLPVLGRSLTLKSSECNAA